MYRGFVSSILSAGGCLLSLGLSVWLYPKIAGPIQANGQLNATLLNYTDALTRMGDQSLAGTVVSQAQGGLPDLIQRVLAIVFIAVGIFVIVMGVQRLQKTNSADYLQHQLHSHALRL